MDWFVLFQHKESQKNEVMPFRHLIELNENSRAWRSNDKDQWPQEEVVASWYVDDRRVTASGYLKFVSQNRDDVEAFKLAYETPSNSRNLPVDQNRIIEQLTEQLNYQANKMDKLEERYHELIGIVQANPEMDNRVRAYGDIVCGQIVNHDFLSTLLIEIGEGNGTGKKDGLGIGLRKLLDNLYPFGFFWGVVWSDLKHDHVKICKFAEYLVGKYIEWMGGDITTREGMAELHRKSYNTLKCFKRALQNRVKRYGNPSEEEIKTILRRTNSGKRDILN